MAICKDCKGKVFWAALRGRSLPFELAEAGVGGFQLYTAHGTRRAKVHPGIGHPNVPAYQLHDCGRRRSQ